MEEDKHAVEREVVIDKAVQKEFKDLPEAVRDQFLVALERLRLGLDPGMPIAHLGTVGKGVCELKRNGSPAYRLIYTLKFQGKVVVLAARPKTTNGADKVLQAAAGARLKAYKQER